MHLKTEFDVDDETAPAIRRKLEWASREKLIRSFSCRPLAGEGDQLVSIEWWDPIDEPVMFSRAHDKRGTRSA